MCVAPSKMKPAQNPYAGNYGSLAVGGKSPISDGERQWYIANGFGDPNQVGGRTQGVQVGKGYLPLPSGSTRYNGRVALPGPITSVPGTGYYQGVSAEARYLYTTAAERAKSIQDASAQYAQEKANASNVRVRDQGVTYNYAGNALAIPGT
jgi:hypothetical protein